MHKLFILLSFLFFIASCNKPGVDTPQESNYIKLDSIQGKYLFANDEPYRGYEATGTAYFTYDARGRIIKREGGLIAIPVTTGYSYFYVKEVYDTISYITNDMRIIDLKTSLAGIIFTGGKKEVTRSNDLISKKIAYHQASTEFDNDTTYYFYDAYKMLQKTEKFSSSSYMIQNFTFDANGNLINVTTTTRNRNTNNIIYTLEENFSNYDNSANPLKSLSFWNDMFFRSLSTNNFRRYSYRKRNSLNEIIGTQEISWSFIYDSNGNVDFSK